MMRISLGIVLAAGLVRAASAETALDCAAVTALARDLSGYAVTAPPAAPVDGWCVLDQARLSAPGRPDLSATTLRLRGTATDAAPVTLHFEVKGVRLALKPGDRQVPDWLQAALRLQRGDLSGAVHHNAAEDRLELQSVRLALSGGSEVRIEARLRGAALSRRSFFSGLLTDLRLTWKNDARLTRAAMEAAGQELDEGAGGPAAIDATRAALGGIVEALPQGSLVGPSREELAQLIRDLPQGPGRLVLDLVSQEGIGAVQIGLLALRDDPEGPEALADLLAGTTLSIDWQPGLAP